MIQNLAHRKAVINDLEQIVNLLLEDELGVTPESKSGSTRMQIEAVRVTENIGVKKLVNG